jgi:hypothetical protein
MCMSRLLPAFRQSPSKTTSTHWWRSDLPPSVAQRFTDIATSAKLMEGMRAVFPSPAFELAPVYGMDEVRFFCVCMFVGFFVSCVPVCVCCCVWLCMSACACVFACVSVCFCLSTLCEGEAGLLALLLAQEPCHGTSPACRLVPPP